MWIGGIIGAIVGGFIAGKFARHKLLGPIVIGVCAILGYTMLPW